MTEVSWPFQKPVTTIAKRNNQQSEFDKVYLSPQCPISSFHIFDCEKVTAPSEK